MTEIGGLQISPEVALLVSVEMVLPPVQCEIALKLNEGIWQKHTLNPQASEDVAVLFQLFIPAWSPFQQERPKEDITRIAIMGAVSDPRCTIRVRDFAIYGAGKSHDIP